MILLYQIQWRFPNKPNELVVQKKMSTKISKSFDMWVQEVKKEHPAPVDAEWIICTEKSKYFIKESKNSS